MRRALHLKKYVLFGAGITLCVTAATAQGLSECTPSRQGYEWCRMAENGGAIDIERSLVAPKAIRSILVRQGSGNDRLAVRALQVAFAAHAVPAGARPILVNAMEQCLRSGAEITSRIGAAEWIFAREAPYACVARIRDGS
jgi:hypothetical protein